MSLDYSKIPISPPPPSIVPNFDDPVSFSTAIIILAIVFLTLSCIFFGGRIYSKLYIAHSPGYDDYLCGGIRFTSYSITPGFEALMGHSCIDIYHEDCYTHTYHIGLLFLFSVFVQTVALFAFQKTVFGETLYENSYQLRTYYCTPGKGQTWRSANIKCGIALPYTIAQAAFNIIVDIYLLCLPIPIVWRLNLSRKRKIGVLSLFMVGIIGVALGIIGLYYRILLLQPDGHWSLSIIYAVLIVEINVAIICSSMPSFAAIFKHHCGKSHFFSSMLTRLRLWGRSREFKSNSWGLQKTAKSNQNTKGGMHRDGPGLPEVPSGEMSRIRTFIWKNNRSAGDSTVEEFTLDEEHPMKPNHRTCVNDRMELSNNQAASQDQNRRQGLGVLDIV